MFSNPMDNFMFNSLPFIVFIIFAIVIMGFVVVFVKGISEYIRNNNTPQKSEPARIINNRTHTWGGYGNMAARTSYYMTFELENGERMEFAVSAQFAGMHIEGDTGILTHQGTRFISFEREVQ
ncbi:MAG: DUF2500 domain-containing protein [Bacillota bacterium]